MPYYIIIYEHIMIVYVILERAARAPRYVVELSLVDLHMIRYEPSHLVALLLFLLSLLLLL